jgi:hypothetical protein
MKTTYDHSLSVLHPLLNNIPAFLERLVAAVTTCRQLAQNMLKATLLAAMVWFCTRAGAATTWTVSSPDDNNGANTLRVLATQAVTQPGDTIVFASALSTITISLGKIVINRNLTITGPGANNLTIIGASPNDRVFEIAPNGPVAVTISGLRFSGGFRGLDGQPGTQQSPNGQSGGPAQGGIIYNDKGCSLTVSNCIMEQCYAIGGNGGIGFGGILAPPGKGGAGAIGQGGAIGTQGILNIYGCSFRSNSAAGGNGGAGTNASSSFNGSNGGDGAWGYGGAIYVEYLGDSPAITAINCTFVNNFAIGGDGGPGGTGLVAAHGGNGGAGNVAKGGALYHANMNCGLGDCGTMKHCTVSQNYLRPGFGGAGGIGNINGTPGADGSGSGGGLFLTTQFFEVGNTIVATDGCLGAGVCTGPDVSGTVASQGYNVIGVDANSGGWVNGAVGFDQRGVAGTPLDPRLGPLQNNGGETLTMAPLAGSPAIDAGTTESVLFDPALGIFVDQARQMRPAVVAGIRNGGDGSDIGAYELQCSLDIPALSIARSGNGVVLSWSWPSTCFILQQSSDLIHWADSTYAINVVGNQNQVVVSPALGNLFFRLKK